ncbi:beta-ketoacyl-[acyl-carrier-protein] synthase family protein [Rhodospirillaceae bacterium SYSU D60014]|uniref:beta-ketoacyl-[acyl-carrier-protein] synthase family protein n=1 Tax=Virgifigura deserti TaxID=2268457 RepID=UPI000E660451
MYRVVITGYGCISALGHRAEDCWQAMRDGRSGIAPITTIPTDLLSVRVAAEVKDYVPTRHFEEKRLAYLDRVVQFALIAAGEALAGSGLPLAESGLAEETAVIVGTGVGGQNTQDDSYRRLYGEGIARLHPFTIPKLMVNAAASHISMTFGISGPAFSVASACASANHAIGQAFWMVRHGQARAAVTGGSEACITVGTMKGWEAMRVMAMDTCRPFCRERRGMILGEGAGILVLERLEDARARGAPILAELAGFGMSADAGDLVQPSAAGAARAIVGALKDAELPTDRIDYVNAHGTGTVANDATETQALLRVFGDHAGRLAVSSTKSMHGHALGAAGALELLAAIRAITDGVVPPTANFMTPDPDCSLDYVPNEARERVVGAALSNSFAFGGLNAVLALRRFD